MPVFYLTPTPEEIDKEILTIKPNDGFRIVREISQGTYNGLLPQYLIYAWDSKLLYPDKSVNIPRDITDPERVRKRTNLETELQNMLSALKTLGITQLDSFPPDPIQQQLLGLGIMIREVLFELNIGRNHAKYHSFFGNNNARIYGLLTIQMSKDIRLNQMDSSDLDVLRRISFYTKFGNKPSQYELTRNMNVALEMLRESRDFSIPSLEETNRKILDGIYPGGVYRTYSLDWTHACDKNPTPPVDQIKPLLIKWGLEISRSKSETDLAHLAMEYDEIHPWVDGTGRCMTVEYNRLRKNLELCPVWIPVEETVQYIRAMRKADNPEDLEGLARYYARHELPREHFVELMHNIIDESRQGLEKR